MKRFISLFLSGIMIITMLPFGVFATELNMSSTASSVGNITTPYSFSRKYEKFFTLGVETEVMSDPNYDIFMDTTVTVTFVESGECEQFSVTIEYKADNATDWIYGKTAILDETDAMSYSIPSGYTFRVLASLIDGNSGNATFQVSLA